MKNQKLKKQLCQVGKCFEIINNSYDKWQLDLCLIHLIDFMNDFIKNEKIIAIFDKFCEKWEKFKNSNQSKTKNKIKKKIKQIQVYFENQKKLAIQFEKLK